MNPRGILIGAMLLIGWGCSPTPTEQPPTIVEGPPPKEDIPQGPPFFEEVTATSGVDFAYRNGEEVQPPHLAILESLGGGLALIDYDGDGLLDLFAPGGGYYDGPDKKQIKGHACKLFRNLGDCHFEDVTASVGLETLANGEPWFYSHGAAVGDYNQDGRPDLLVTGWARIALFQNVDGTRFEDVSAATQLDQGVTWATSAAWADLDGDTDSDLYVCQYADWSFANHPGCSYDGTTADVCPPKQFNGLRDLLYRNNGDGTFTEIGAEVGLKPGDDKNSKGLGVVIVDVNLDGKPDVYVANDTVDNSLYLNESVDGKIILKEDGLLAGVARDGNGGSNGSMGLAVGDPNQGGKPWLWVTNYEDELHALYRNASTGPRANFFFHTPESGIAALGQKYVGWGTGFLDLEHDGWEDLYVVNGHAIRYPKTASRRQLPVLLHNRGDATFGIMTPRGGDYFQSEHLARGSVMGDLDNDGRVDLAVSHMNDPVAILRNIAETKGNHWLGIDLAGANHADVVGARILVETGNRTQYRFAVGGGSYASAQDTRHVIGLGDATVVDRVQVTWPNGQEQEWTDLEVDRYHQLSQTKP